MPQAYHHHIDQDGEYHTDLTPTAELKVQRREYQLTLMEVRTSELNAIAMGEEVTPASVESIRRDFELHFGSRIMIH